jgi:hypothetical protein
MAPRKKPNTTKQPTKSQSQLTLTPSNITEENSKYNKLTKITLSSGEYTEIHEYFIPQKIIEMIKDFADFTGEFEKFGGKIDTEDYYLYFTLHLIKHFSTVCPIFPSNFSEKLDFLNNLAQHPLVYELKDKFDEKEVAKVYEMLFTQLEKYQDLMKQNSEFQAKFKAEIAKLDNSEIINSIVFGDESDAPVQ